MKPSQIVLLVIVLVFLLVGIGVKKLHHPEEWVTEEFTPLELAFKLADVSRVKLQKGEEEAAILVRTEKGWIVQDLWGARADEEKVWGFLNQLHAATGELRADDADLFEDFGLSEKEAFHVLLENADGESLLHLLIGVKRAEPNTLFLREDGSEKIYLSRAPLFNRMGIYGPPETADLKAGHWADLRILKLKSSAGVRSFETRRFENGEEIVLVSLTRQDGADKGTLWDSGGEASVFPLDGQKIMEFLESAMNWNAVKVLEPQKDYGFDRPYWGMRIVLETDQEILLTAAVREEEGKKVHFLRSSQDPVVFEISEYTMRRLDIDASRFFADNPLGIRPGQVKGIVIQKEKTSVSIDPEKQKTAAVTKYLNILTRLSVEKLLLGPRAEGKLKTPGEYRIEILSEGAEAPLVLDFGKTPLGEDKEYPAQKRGHTQAFTVSEGTFRKLFDNLEELAG